MVRLSLERLSRMEAEFEQANVRMGEAVWNTYSGEGAADLDGAQREISRILTNSPDRALVDGWLEGIDRKAEPLLARRLQVWSNCFKGSAVDNMPEIYTLKNRLQERIANFQLKLDGKPVRRSDLQKLLRNEPDRALRHRAWCSIAALAEANRADLRRLIGLRNAGARALGYRDYVDLVLKLQELDESWLHQTLDRLAAEARPLYRALIGSLERKIGEGPLAPWDVAFAMRQGFQLPDSYFPADKALERLRATVRGIGFEIDSLPIRTVVRDIPFGGYTVAVRIPSDARFIVNPSEGHGFYTTTFHEYGHSLQAACTTIEWPILKEYEWVLGAHTPAYSEGMAEVLGGFARRADWLRSMAAVPEAEVERYRTQLLPAQMAARLFDLLLNMRVELAAYAGEEDMAACERRLTSDVRLLQFPAEDPPQWEANTWYTSYPVYWHNYILAALIADQINETITERFGSTANPEVSGYLRANFYATGNAVPWMDRITNGTRKPLSPDAYLKKIHRASSGSITQNATTDEHRAAKPQPN